MYRYHPSFTFHQHYFGRIPVYVIFIEPGRANRSLMTFMQQYRNRMQYRHGAALKQHDYKQEKQEKKPLAFQKTQDEEILRDFIQQKREWRKEQQTQAFLKTEEEQYIQQRLEWREQQNLKNEKEEKILRLGEEQKQDVKSDLTCTWEIPRWDEEKQHKMSIQTQILENELIDSLQNRHLEEEVRVKHMLQKRHLEEQLKAKRELQTRHLEEQLRVMHSLQKRQLEEELREKRLLQERQLEEELKAKESLQKRHLEEELRVKELVLNRKRILRNKRCELKKQIPKQEQPQKLQEKQTKVQAGQDVERLQQSQENLKREKLKELLKQEIRKLKQEIQLEKMKETNDSEDMQKNAIVQSEHSLSETDFAKHLRRHIIGSKLLRCHGYPVESITHDGCVEIHKYLPDQDLSKSITNYGVSNTSSSSSFTVISETIDNNVDDFAITNEVDKDQNHSQLVEFGPIPSTEKHKLSSTNSSLSVISDTNDDLAITSKGDKDQNQIQLVEFGTFSPTEKHKSPTMSSSSTNNSFSVISDTTDNNVDDLAITNKGDKDQNQTQLVEFGPIPPTKEHKSTTMPSSSTNSSFSVISEANDNDVDGLMINHRGQNCRQFDESLRKDCVRCGQPFYVNELGEYLNREICTYHWGKLHYTYKGKRGYIPQYTCCEGHKGSEGCARHPLHIWSGIVDGVNGPYNDFLRTRACCEKTADAPKVYALQCKMCFTGRGLEVTKVMLMGYDGQLVYEQYVQPSTDIVDYWMYYSDNSRTDQLESRSFKRLTDVQQDLLELIDADTILIGYCLEHELRVLRILHNNIVDIAIEFAHPLGLFPGRSLQNLAEIYLRRCTQGGSETRDSLEDMRICLELMKWRVREHKRQIGSNLIPELN